ncbi:MAG: hypothetical protein Q8N99_08620 [Nanoarchaeota archaeon]|nr:hypothetical protein [Nanoarchaeota archaeon]
MKTLETIISRTINKAKQGLKSLAYAGLATIALVGGMRGARADTITWHYEDDFSSTKAESDSYDHSIFWPEMAFPPPDPYLYYSSAIPPAEMLGLEGYFFTEENAFLAYAFPLDNVLTRVDSGTFELDVLLPDFSDPLRPAYYLPPYVLYGLSENGVNWTEDSPLVEGYNQIPLLPSNNNFTYIRLSANSARIDNISVTVSGPEIPEPSTLELLGIGLTGLLYSLYKQKKFKS